MTLKQIFDIMPYDEHIEVDQYVRSREGNYYKEIFIGRKLYFASENFLNAKVRMISTLPAETGTTLYIVIE